MVERPGGESRQIAPPDDTKRNLDLLFCVRYTESTPQQDGAPASLAKSGERRRAAHLGAVRRPEGQ